jgi:hypothetical protein
MFFILYFFIRRPSYSTVVEEAGFEPWTFATLAWESDALTHRVDRVPPPPPLWFRRGGGAHSLAGEGVVSPNSDEGTDTVLL